MSVDLHAPLHPVELLHINEDGKLIGDHDLAVSIFPDVFPILQHRAKAADPEGQTLCRADAPHIEGVHNIRHAACANGKAYECIISTDDSKVKILVIPTNEELMIARDTMQLVSE